ncbi:hypothetical protein SAMN05421503_0159 [Terribacillus aidingensis]|uniref:Uncharacterized protein n=1 Tax=Terribacillus aidingensis TaxID=586416 RepID=A0A285MZL6_9BACI|nr:hypothetical protein [Terribacillus aidingensis]SNZ02634.1 hypothetical protein SAMN05421503_0159 [Terribacillus aidingensis]
MKEHPHNPKQPNDNMALLLALITVIPAACNQVLDAAHKTVKLLQLFF